MTTATVREAIHERLDPVIEEIVTREISQRGGYGRGMEQEQGRSFEALMPILLSTLMQRRPSGQETGLENILPVLPILLQSLARPQAGREERSPLENILPILPVLLPAIMQQRRPGALGGQEQGQVLQNILPILPALLPLLQGRQAGQEAGRPIQAILPVLLSSLVSRQSGQEPGQQNPLQTLAPALVALAC